METEAFNSLLTLAIIAITLPPMAQLAISLSRYYNVQLLETSCRAIQFAMEEVATAGEKTYLFITVEIPPEGKIIFKERSVEAYYGSELVYSFAFPCQYSTSFGGEKDLIHEGKFTIVVARSELTQDWMIAVR